MFSLSEALWKAGSLQRIISNIKVMGRAVHVDFRGHTEAVAFAEETESRTHTRKTSSYVTLVMGKTRAVCLQGQFQTLHLLCKHGLMTGVQPPH